MYKIFEGGMAMKIIEILKRIFFKKEEVIKEEIREDIPQRTQEKEKEVVTKEKEENLLYYKDEELYAEIRVVKDTRKKH